MSSLWLLVLVGTVQGLTLPLVVALRAAVLWMYEEHATPKLNFVMAAFGAGSTIAPLVYDGFAALESGSPAPLDWTFWGLAAASALLGERVVRRSAAIQVLFICTIAARLRRQEGNGN